MGDIFDDENEPTMTMEEYIEGVEAQELEADLVLGGDEGKDCTYSQGYLKRQAVFSCLTCTPAGNAGVCTACCLSCHDGHEVVELWTRRQFRCDCGNSKFGGICCKLLPDKEPENKDNSYNQNYKGLYCTCHRPYPDPDQEDQVEMIQCCICEDWFHENHLCLESIDQIPRDEEGEPVYEDFVCRDCAEHCSFLSFYREIILVPSMLTGTATSNGLARESMQVNVNEKDNAKNETSERMVPCGEILFPTESLVLGSNISKHSDQVFQTGSLINSTVNIDDKLVQPSSVGQEAANVMSETGFAIAPGLCGKPVEGPALVNQVTECCRPNAENSTLKGTTNSGQLTGKLSLLSDQVTKGTDVQDKQSVCKLSIDALGKENVKESVQVETSDRDNAKNETSQTTVACGEMLVPAGSSKNISKHGNQIMHPGSLINYTVNGDDQLMQPSSPGCKATNVISETVSFIASGPCGNKAEPSESIGYSNQVTACYMSNAGSSTSKDLDNSWQLIAKSSLSLDQVTTGTKIQGKESGCKLNIDVNGPLLALESKKSMFLAKNWRELLCRCSNCLDLYGSKRVTFLLDKGDTLEEYEKIAKQKREEKLHQQEGVELRFLQNLGHVQQIELLSGISDMKNELRSYLESFDTTRAVTSADIQKFFQNLERKRQRLV